MRFGVPSIVIMTLLLAPVLCVTETSGADDTCMVHFTNTDGIKVTFTSGTSVDENTVQIENEGTLSFTAYSEKYDLSISSVQFYAYNSTTGEIDTDQEYRFNNNELPYCIGYNSYFTIYGVNSDMEIVFTDAVEYPADYNPETETPEEDTVSTDTEKSNIYGISIDPSLVMAVIALMISLTFVIICYREYIFVSKKLEEDLV
jgi:hypothetical protein